MWLVIVEALAALALLVFIVWWTMFAGRRRGERPAHDELAQGDAAEEAQGRARGVAPGVATGSASDDTAAAHHQEPRADRDAGGRPS